MAEDDFAVGQGSERPLPTVVANVSNFVPKPQTPFQWNGMQRREYFQGRIAPCAGPRLRCVQVKCRQTSKPVC